jgi:hypothetical protein
MKSLASLIYIGPEKKLDRFQLLFKSQPGIPTILFFNRREHILNLLQQLRFSRSQNNSGNLIIHVNGFEYNLGYDAWKAVLFLLEHWFNRIADEE